MGDNIYLVVDTDGECAAAFSSHCLALLYISLIDSVDDYNGHQVVLVNIPTWQDIVINKKLMYTLTYDAHKKLMKVNHKRTPEISNIRDTLRKVYSCPYCKENILQIQIECLASCNEEAYKIAEDMIEQDKIYDSEGREEIEG